MDRHTRGPLVDSAQTTSRTGIFAIGNLTHPVDTADVAALDGRAVAEHALRYLSDPAAASARQFRVLPGDNLRWLSPGRIDPAIAPPRNRILSWPTRQISIPTVTTRQDGRTIARRRLSWPASPGRVFRIPVSLLAGASVEAGPVRVDIG
jgi:hypothetical protein